MPIARRSAWPGAKTGPIHCRRPQRKRAGGSRAIVSIAATKAHTFSARNRLIIWYGFRWIALCRHAYAARPIHRAAIPKRGNAIPGPSLRQGQNLPAPELLSPLKALQEDGRSSRGLSDRVGNGAVEVILNLTFGELSRAIWFSRIRRWRFRKAGEATFGGPPQTNLSRLPEEMNWEERPFRSLSSKLIMTRSGNCRLAGRLYGKPFRAARAV